jgi:hypothetical protein
MKQSNSRIAVLKAVEEDIYIRFCKYRYTDACIMPDYKEEVQVAETKHNGLTVTYGEEIAGGAQTGS